MMERWQQYCDKFLTLTPREKYLIVLCGFGLVVLLPFMLVIDPKMISITSQTSQISKIKHKFQVLHFVNS